MMRLLTRSLTMLGLGLAGAHMAMAQGAAAPDPERLRQTVSDTERAFAKTMADRDFAAFSAFVADEAIFIDEPKSLIGKAEVLAAWKPLYEKAETPFSWEPSEVQVLNSGKLALSTGPVRNPKGKLIGTFTSIWRLETGRWRIIFDRGNSVCDQAKSQ